MAVYLPKGTTDLGTLASLNNETLIVAEGSQTVTAGLDQSALAADVENIFIGERAAVSFRGTSGAFLKCSIGTLFLIKSAGGRIYYTPVGTGTTTTCARLKNIGAAQVFLAGGGTVVNLEIGGAGFVDIADDTNVTNIYMSGGSCNQLYKSTANTDWIIGDGASFTTGRGWSGTARIGGGASVVVAREDTSATLPTGATLEMAGGTLSWRGGNITTINACGDAALDFGDAPNALTITNLTVTRGVLERSRFKSKFATITITNLYVKCSERDEIIK